MNERQPPSGLAAVPAVAGSHAAACSLSQLISALTAVRWPTRLRGSLTRAGNKCDLSQPWSVRKQLRCSKRNARYPAHKTGCPVLWFNRSTQETR